MEKGAAQMTMSNSVSKPLFSYWYSRADKSEDPGMRVWRCRRQCHWAGPKMSVQSITWAIIFFRVFASRKARVTFPVKRAYNAIAGVGTMSSIFSAILTAPFQSWHLEFSLMSLRVQDVCFRLLTFNIVIREFQSYLWFLEAMHDRVRGDIENVWKARRGAPMKMRYFELGWVIGDSSPFSVL